MSEVSVVQDDINLALDMKGATDAVIHRWADENLEARLEGLAGDREIVSLRRLGLRPGENIARVLNREIEDAAPGTVFFVPPVALDDNCPGWRVDEPIELKSGISIVGSGHRLRGAGHHAGGSWIYRTGNFPVFKARGADPAPHEDASWLMIADFRLEGLFIAGNDKNTPILEFRNVSTMTLRDCCVFGGMEQCMKIDGHFQDSLFFNNRWEWGGTFDGTIPMIEIDNSTVAGNGCSNNIVFISNTLESYRGTGLRIHGAAGSSYLPTHWCSFTNMKMESCMSNVPHLVMDYCSGIEMGLRTFWAHGTPDEEGRVREPGDETSCLIRMNSCWGIDLKANFGIGAGGRDVESVVDMSNSTRCTVNLRMSDNMVPRKIYGPSFVRMNCTEGNSVQVDYHGGHSWGELTAPVKKLTAPAVQPVEINTRESTVTATGGFRLNEAGLGTYHGVGEPGLAMPDAPVGSVYHRADGQPGQAFYVKEGPGPRGWVAK